jgi:hypothetical protein
MFRGEPGTVGFHRRQLRHSRMTNSFRGSMQVDAHNAKVGRCLVTPPSNVAGDEAERRRGAPLLGNVAPSVLYRTPDGSLHLRTTCRGGDARTHRRVTVHPARAAARLGERQHHPRCNAIVTHLTFAALGPATPTYRLNSALLPAAADLPGDWDRLFGKDPLAE